MSKLWIVHRSPAVRASLARASGMAPQDLLAGEPLGRPSVFAGAPAPVAVVIGLDGDFEAELEFAHRERERLRRARLVLVSDETDVGEAKRLFDVSNPEVLTNPIDRRALRTLLAGAIAARGAASLAERHHRERIAERFSIWLGGLEVPGLLRALDPALASLPLLVRGVKGSGRGLLGRYVELFRGGRGRTLRLHARDLHDVDQLVSRLDRSRPAVAAVWIDEVDTLPVSSQQALAEWLRHEAPPPEAGGPGLRFIATAGPAGLRDSLDAALESAFAPLSLTVPSLADHPETLDRFAQEVAQAWMRSIGGAPRRFAPSAIEALATEPWSGDRAEVEAVLRSSLAACASETLEADALRLPGDPAAFDESRPPSPERQPETQAEPIEPLPLEPQATETDALPVVEAEIEPGIDAPTSAEGSISELERAFLDGAGATGAAEEPIGWLESEEGGAAPSAEMDEIDDDQSTRLAAASFDTGLAPGPPDALTERAAAEAPAAETSRFDDPAQPGLEHEAEAPIAAGGPNDDWRRLARSLSHEIRNPLVSIRTFAELLPEHFDDETFRQRFTELVGKDVAHIGDVLSRLSSVAEHEKLEAAAVDVSAMIEGLLQERRERIGLGRLLVLRELEREAPLAWADGHLLREALAGLLDRALASLPERGDLFVATRHIERSSDGAPRLRVLLRHHSPELAGDRTSLDGELDPVVNALEYVIAETVIAASGGSLTIDTTDAHETLILVDLRTPDQGAPANPV